VLPAEFRHILRELRIAGQRLDGPRAAASSIATIAVSRVKVKTQSWPVRSVVFPRRETSTSLHNRADPPFGTASARRFALMAGHNR
jgi:hypothetical protein